MTLSLLAMPGDEALADRIAAGCGAPRAAAEVRRFPDGESYVRIDDDLSGRSVAIVARLDRPDAKLPRLLFAADAARDRGAEHVGLVAPYLPYMRQDDRFKPGEALTSATFARWMSGHFDALFTVDPHLHRFGRLEEIYTLRAWTLSSAGRIAEWIASHVERPVVIGPDDESEQWVRAVAEERDLPWRILTKQRFGDRDVQITGDGLETVRERTPVLVDDIVSSGATLAEAARALREAGLAAPRCVVVHGLFGDGSRETLVDAGIVSVTCTDSVDVPEAGIGLAGVIAPALAQWAGVSA